MEPVLSNPHQTEQSQSPGTNLSMPRYILDRGSPFGELIGPLYDTLADLRDAPPGRSIKSVEWKLAAFPHMHTAFRGKDLLAIPQTIEDQMFTMTDELADQIRRIYNHEWLAQFIAERVGRYKPQLESRDLELANDVSQIMRAVGFSQFLGDKDSRELLLDSYPQANELIMGSVRVSEAILALQDRSSLLDGIIREVRFELKKECSRRASAVMDTWFKHYQAFGGLITDPDHSWENLASDFNTLLVHRMDMNAPRKLNRAVSFMIVEDNPLHQWSFSYLLSVHNAYLYAPRSAIRQKSNPTIHPFCYPSVVEAEAAIAEAIENGMCLPDVLLTDIELLDADRDGLDLIESIDRMLRDVGRRQEVQLMMVYSSNLRIYEERVRELTARGIIDGAQTKKDFKLESILSPFKVSNHQILENKGAPNSQRVD